MCTNGYYLIYIITFNWECYTYFFHTTIVLLIIEECFIFIVRAMNKYLHVMYSEFLDVSTQLTAKKKSLDWKYRRNFVHMRKNQ